MRPVGASTPGAAAEPRQPADVAWERALEALGPDLGAARTPRPAMIGLGAAAVTAAGAALWHYWRGRAAERAHPPIGRFVEVDGIPVHYIEKGDGPPLVLIHGNGGMVEDLVVSGLFDRLAQNHRVIALDRPGCGYTGRPRSRLWTAAAQARLLRSAVRRLGVERPLVVGHSFGAMVAMAWALDHQDELAGVVLMSGYYYPTPRRDVLVLGPPGIPVIGDVMRYTISPPLSRLALPAFLKAIFSPRPVPRRFLADFPLELSLRPWQLRATAEETDFLIPSAAAMRGRYGELRLPVAIITGDADRVITAQRQSMRLHDDVPHSTLRVLPGLGHMIHYFAQDEIAATIEALGGARPQRGGGDAVRRPDHIPARTHAADASTTAGAA